MRSAAEVLKKHWGFDSFRHPQQEIIQSVLDGNDTLVLMPTGGGKSLCYQIPALMKDGVCLVVSPLIALMKDQVENLRKKKIKAGCIVSGMTSEQQANVLTNCHYGNLKLLYVAPERLKSRTFLSALKEIHVSMIAVDEAHCISQWGYDFRPSYLEIAEIRSFFPSVPVIALTATATPLVADDICTRLLFRNAKRFISSFYRDNLAYMVFHEPDKHNRLLRIIRKVGGSGIVYVPTRRSASEMSQFLNKHGVSSDYYHAGLSKRGRDSAQNRWMDDAVKVMVATNAFGMGIDKPDVRFVVHTYVPATIEAYFQESGRAGRDGKLAYAVMLYTEGDIANLDRNIEQSYPDVQTVRGIYDSLCCYLSIPMGYGENEEFELDVEKFCRKYALSPITVWTSLGILERDGLVYMPSKEDVRSSLMITVSRDTIYDYANNYPQYGSVIESVMRLYGGVFVGFTEIEEALVARVAGLDTATVESMLMRLDSLNLISYKKGNPNQTIVFTAPRCTIDNLQVGGVGYTVQKKNAIQRKQSMVEYLRATEPCRSIQLLRYFGEQSSRNCGKCDICISRNKCERDAIEKRIVDLLQNGPLSVSQLLSHFEDIDETAIRRQARAMVDARLIGIDKEMRLYV